MPSFAHHLLRASQTHDGREWVCYDCGHIVGEAGGMLRGDDWTEHERRFDCHGERVARLMMVPREGVEPSRP